VYAKDDFSSFSPPPIPVLPDWSPTNSYNGYYSTKGKRTTKDKLDTSADSTAITAMIHQCIGSCNVHGHNHNNARLSNVPVNNYTAFWGALGCSCFAF
jgi:hypothetical protein